MDKPGESKWVLACDLERLTKQGIVCARLGRVDLILIWHEGHAVACERTCPHEQADLSRGHILAGRLVCPHHAASFDLEDGSISSGWSSRPLRIYPVRIEQGEVRVGLDASKA